MQQSLDAKNVAREPNFAGEPHCIEGASRDRGFGIN